MLHKIYPFFKKRIRRLKLTKLLKFYWNFFYLDNAIYVVKNDEGFLPKTYVFFLFPIKQLIFQIFYIPLFYHKGLTMGSFIKWNFKRAKFYRRQLKSITPFSLLFWQYFKLILEEDIFIIINNFNFYLASVLERYWEVIDFIPFKILIKKAFSLIFYKYRRIKKRVYKSLSNIS